METLKDFLSREWLNAPIILWILALVLAFIVLLLVPIRFTRKNGKCETVLETKPTKQRRRRDR